MEVINAANLYLRQLGDQRPNISTLNSNIFTSGGPEPKSLVEISGAPNCGKSLLLMQLVAHCLPQCDVVLLNLSHKIDVQFIGKLINDVANETKPNVTSTELQEIAKKCMDSLEIINCFTSEEFELALEALDHILLDNGRISLIAVDTLCEYFWVDVQTKARQRKYRYYMNYLARLRKICNKFYVSCIYTVDSSFFRHEFTLSKSVLIDYKLHLDYSNGQRSLNQKNIIIKDNSVQFEVK